MNNIPQINNGRSNETEQMAAQPPCLKVFIQRDYSEGTVVKFQTRFPSELEGRIERQAFEHTVNQLNAYFQEAEKASCSTYCEGCLACLTAYLIYICKETHYEKKIIIESDELDFEYESLLKSSSEESDESDSEECDASSDDDDLRSGRVWCPLNTHQPNLFPPLFSFLGNPSSTFVAFAFDVFLNIIQCLRKVSKFIAEQNERVYQPRGLVVTDPCTRGLRVLEISCLDRLPTA